MPNGQRLIALTATMLGLLTVAPALTAASRCPNLSGVYMLQGEDGQVHISIRQRKCDSVTIIRKSDYLGTTTSETHILTLDGKEQPDSPWYGHSPVQNISSAKFVGSELVIDVKVAGDSPLTVFYSLNSERDLQEEALIDRRRDRRGSPSVAKRER